MIRIWFHLLFISLACAVSAQVLPGNTIPHVPFHTDSSEAYTGDVPFHTDSSEAYTGDLPFHTDSSEAYTGDVPFHTDFGEAGSGFESRLLLVFGGDIMGHDTQIASALATGSGAYDYRPCFAYLKPYLQEADLVIGNLEVTLAGPPYKGYPQFSSPDELADALKDAGFDILVTANNHALDRNRDGLVRTIQELDRRAILHAGTFTDARQRMLHYPLIVEKSGIRIALLNYTYGTNGLIVKPPSIVNRIDTAQIKMDLLKAKSAEPDFIITLMHWGSEYQLTQNSDQTELAEFLFRHGTDVILGSHPHVVQPIIGNSKGDLVVFSVGNLISNQRNRYRNGGILLELELVKDQQGTGIRRHAFLPVWVYKPSNKKGTMFTLVPAAIDSVTTPAAQMSAEDYDTMRQFLGDTRLQLDGVPETDPDWLE